MQIQTKGNDDVEIELDGVREGGRVAISLTQKPCNDNDYTGPHTVRWVLGGDQLNDLIEALKMFQY